MTIYEGSKHRIYPTQEQEGFFEKCCEASVFIWNTMLRDSMDAYEATGKRIIKTPASYKTEHPWLREVDSQALASERVSLKKAYKAFYKKKSLRHSKKTIEKAERDGRELAAYDYGGHPKFKAKKKRNWYRYTTHNHTKSNPIRVVDGKYIRLPKAGLVKCNFHRKILENRKIKSVTVSRAASGKWYVSVLTKGEAAITQVIPESVIGLDYSMSKLYVDDEGNDPEFVQFFSESQAMLDFERQKLDNMKKGSKNHDRQVVKVARIHAKIANRRRDFLHKLSRNIADNYDLVCIEDLGMDAMSRMMYFGKTVRDNGWGMFTKMLEYKLERHGRHLIKIERNYPSSKLCHVCGEKNNDLALNDREWTCQACNTHHDRDVNAAINIKERGIQLFDEMMAKKSLTTEPPGSGDSSLNPS